MDAAGEWKESEPRSDRDTVVAGAKEMAHALDTAHKGLHAIAERLDLLEKSATRDGQTDFMLALQRAYAGVVDAGEALVSAHVQLNNAMAASARATSAGVAARLHGRKEE